MKMLKTKNQEKLAQYATRLDILRELDKREALDEELKLERRKLESKMWDSIELLYWIKHYSQTDWAVLQNLSFIYDTEVITCDVLLITNNRLYCFDIDTHLLNSSSLVDSKLFDEVQSSTPFIQEVLRQAGYERDVQGYVLLLQGVQKWSARPISSPTQIITRDHLRETIEEIVVIDSSDPATVDMEGIFEIIEKEEFKISYEPEPVDEEIMQKVRPGICCSHCESFDVEIGEVYISCDCGMHESLEEAIVRTICEYGVINNHITYFDPIELLEFFDGDITLFHLMFYLEKHF